MAGYSPDENRRDAMALATMLRTLRELAKRRPGGMLTLSETAACEWASAGVRVDTVAPGGTASSGFDVYSQEAKRKLLKFASGVPFQRFGTGAEVVGCDRVSAVARRALHHGTYIRIKGATPDARNTWELEANERSEPFEGFRRATMRALLRDGK